MILTTPIFVIPSSRSVCDGVGRNLLFFFIQIGPPYSYPPIVPSSRTKDISSTLRISLLLQPGANHERFHHNRIWLHSHGNHGEQ
jgi:hypothetical protein